jgi:hypothetical protein
MKKLLVFALSFAFVAHSYATDNLTEQISLATEMETTSLSVANEDTYDEGLFKHLGVGVRASTMGLGLEVSTTLSKNFKLRGGYNFASYSHDFSISMDDDNLRQAVGYDPDYKTTGKLQFSSGHLLLDIHPMRYGVFHFTAGVFIGGNKIKANGRLVDPTTGAESELLPGEDWPQLALEKHLIDINGGKIDAAFHLGDAAIKPYFGIGIGRSLPKSRLGFMFELGALYQGDYVIKQNGKEVNLTNTINESFEDIGDYTKWLKWWPVLNFQLTYRIF